MPTARTTAVGVTNPLYSQKEPADIANTPYAIQWTRRSGGAGAGPLGTNDLSSVGDRGGKLAVSTPVVLQAGENFT